MWLGIETSSVVSSVAVMNESQLFGEITIQAGLTHSEQLVPRFLYWFAHRNGDGKGYGLCITNTFIRRYDYGWIST